MQLNLQFDLYGTKYFLQEGDLLPNSHLKIVRKNRNFFLKSHNREYLLDHQASSGTINVQVSNVAVAETNEDAWEPTFHPEDHILKPLSESDRQVIPFEIYDETIVPTEEEAD